MICRLFCDVRCSASIPSSLFRTFYVLGCDSLKISYFPRILRYQEIYTVRGMLDSRLVSVAVLEKSNHMSIEIVDGHKKPYNNLPLTKHHENWC